MGGPGVEEGGFCGPTSRAHALEFRVFGSTGCQAHLVRYSQVLDISKSQFPH